GDERVSAIVRREAAEKLQTAVFQDKKQDRADAVNKVKEETAEIVTKELGEDNFDPVAIKIAYEELEEEAYRENILKHGKRVDGRGPRDLREITGEVGVLPRVHG